MSDYICENCGASGIKLWRLYQSFTPHLRCAVCAGKDQDRDISKIDEDGRRPSDTFPSMRTDQIGWYIPAVPGGDTYWGYTSVPDEDIEEWRKLPTLKIS